MKFKKNTKVNDHSIIWTYGKGLIAAYVFVCFIFIVMALLITYTNISESIIPMLSSITMIMGSTIGGIYVGAKFKKKGWLNGGLLGLVYIILITLMGLIFINGFALNIYVVYKLLIGLISGGIGGMIGVNFK